MRFTLSPDQKLFRDATCGLLDRVLPMATIRALGDSGTGFDRQWWRAGAGLGWVSALVPDRLGGGSVSDSGLVDLAILAQEMGRRVTPGPLAVSNVVAQTLAHATDADSRREVIEAVVAGERIVTWAVAEDSGSFQPLAPRTSAERSDDGWRLSGQKIIVEAGDQADDFLVTASGPGGPVQLLVPAGAPGVSVEPVRSLDIVRRFATVTFDEVALPESARIESAEGATVDVIRQWNTLTALQSVETVGVLDRVLEFTVQWAFDRFTFGRPLASYQALKHRFADMYTWHQAATATADEAIDALVEERSDATDAVASAGAFVGQRATDIIQDCVQMHGGIAFTWEHDIHLYLRRATVNRVTYGQPTDHLLRLADAVAAAA